LNAIDEYRDAIREFLASIVTGVGDKHLCADDVAQANAITSIVTHSVDAEKVYLMVDIDLGQIIDFFMGDTLRVDLIYCSKRFTV